ncbi:MAG: amidase [Alphaproteobacteria bacterium]|nr:amidase [Alphaproteobacteria bacterium]
MSDTDLAYTPASTLARLIREKSLSPVALVGAILRRIEASQPVLNAFITVTADQALNEARAAEAAVMRGDTIGPLHGVPFSAKDLINTAGVKTTFGSFALEHNVPAKDTVAVARLRRAGAILVGKTTTPEFGHKPLTEAPLFGRTLNPWDRSRSPGGSSGGAGAATAAGLAPLALGTDGGGSIRIPAACCGVVGFKPTLGMVPHDQALDAFANLAFIGPMTRTVMDSALMMQAMAGPDANDPHSLARATPNFAAASEAQGDLKGVGIHWRLFLGNDAIDPETQRLFEDAVAVFADLGAGVERRETEFANTLPIWGPLTFSAWASRFGRYAEEIGDRMSDSLRTWMAQGRQYGATDIQDSLAQRTSVFRAVQAWFEDCDLVVMPTLAGPAIAADHDAMAPYVIAGRAVGALRAAWYPYTHPFNMTGHPAITVPCGWTAAGLPVALQIVGPWWSDDRVMRAAALFEQARPWAERRPMLPFDQ